MFLRLDDSIITMAGKSESNPKTDESYRGYQCKEENNGKECGFQVKAKTDDEVIEHAHMHQELAHGVKTISPDLQKRIKASIIPVSPYRHEFE